MNWLASHNRWRELAEDRWRFAAQLTLLVDGQFNAYEGMVTEQFYFIDWSALGNSVRLFEKDERRRTTMSAHTTAIMATSRGFPVPGAQFGNSHIEKTRVCGERLHFLNHTWNRRGIAWK